MTINHTERPHSDLGASSMSRWATCPASVQLIKKMRALGELKDSSSIYADMGSVAHQLCELCLELETEPEEHLGHVFDNYPEISVDEEMVEAAQIYVDFIRANHTEGRTELSIEERFHLSDIDEELYGTGDAAIAEEFGKLMIIDFKYGKGVPVEAVENKQMLYYTLGGAMGGDYMTYEAVIIQPRAEHPDGPIRRWSFSQERLDAFKKELKEAVNETRKDSPTFNPTDSACRFCPVKANCKAIKERAIETAMVVFDDSDTPSLPRVDSIPNTEIGRVLALGNLIRDWVGELESHAHHLLERGQEVEGYKLVRGRANRRWGDEASLISDLELIHDNLDELYTPRKLKSPAQLEKIVGKEIVAKYSEKPEGKITLAKSSDKRAAILPAAEIFDKEI